MKQFPFQTRHLRLVPLVALLSLSCCATELPMMPPLEPYAALPPRVDPVDHPFQLGEDLTYSATVAGFHAGAARMRVQADPDNPEHLIFELSAASSPLASLAWDYEESLRVVAEAATLRPQQANSHSVLDQKSHDVRSAFDALTGTIIVHRTKANRSSVRVIAVEDAWDPLSLVYLMRGLDLNTLVERSFDVLVGTRLYRLSITRVGSETLDLDALGEIPCLHLRIKLWRHGLVRIEPDEIDVWMASEGAHELIQVDKGTALGHLKLQLASRN